MRTLFWWLVVLVGTLVFGLMLAEVSESSELKHEDFELHCMPIAGLQNISIPSQPGWVYNGYLCTESIFLYAPKKTPSPEQPRAPRHVSPPRDTKPQPI